MSGGGTAKLKSPDATMSNTGVQGEVSSPPTLPPIK